MSTRFAIPTWTLAVAVLHGCVSLSVCFSLTALTNSAYAQPSATPEPEPFTASRYDDSRYDDSRYDDSRYDDSRYENSRQEEARQEEAAAEPERHSNHLVNETSPYLLLHAHNPVDWHPWNEETLQKARDLDRPIFLSIGYSSCHWCHVMERESFVDEEIANILNENFICIKVDREERPDVDQIYMRSLLVYQALTETRRGGGWPLTMFLTPEALPFFGGTYFPARDGDRGAHTGLMTLLDRVIEGWAMQRESIESAAQIISDATRKELAGLEPPTDFQLTSSLYVRCQAMLEREFDAAYGGFGYTAGEMQSPKFPQASMLMFLLSQAKHDKGPAAKQSRDMLINTLRRMAEAGIRDHLAGGFHRYTVDRAWQVPHFEKMLYDNGQLATLYAEAYALTGDEFFSTIAEEICQFVVDELRADHGGFYSALDAESEGVEGKFYRWSREEIREVLGDDYDFFAQVYGLQEAPNFDGFYSLTWEERIPDAAAALSLEQDELLTRLAPLLGRLKTARDSRQRPATDTKVLTAWNGLMIRGLADVGRLLEKPEFIQVAAEAAEFVLDNLATDDLRLKRTYGQEQAQLNAYLTDYALFNDGLIALHAATDDARWLGLADRLMQKQIDLFWDDAQGGFFFTSNDHESLLARSKNPVDQAIPAGSSLSTSNLLYLASELDRPEYRELAFETVRSVAATLERVPSASPRLLAAARELVEASD